MAASCTRRYVPSLSSIDAFYDEKTTDTPLCILIIIETSSNCLMKNLIVHRFELVALRTLLLPNFNTNNSRENLLRVPLTFPRTPSERVVVEEKKKKKKKKKKKSF